ncbi:response regulator transcription factor [Bacillus infantis]|uniref:response regulator transcription factor n=1 Tax=Bacillus infantis TaxID=324767 RepID=UPI00215571E4|nr:response regulator transcription factor [Bacillus infantis]MCR6611598.1 response regulator transcription factor [Bacillus infantis]
MSDIEILIVDDEEDMRHLIGMYLENAGFSCRYASGGKETLEEIQNNLPDLILLDIMMPDEDGFSVCERVRAQYEVPVIFLSAKGEEWDKVKGLQIGGDDYIVKPFSPGELTARIHAVLRRSGSSSGADSNITAAGKITIDKKARSVKVEGSYIMVTLKEYELLMFFIGHQSHALSREQLLEQIWGMDYLGSLRTVDTHIKTLRMKLGAGDYIKTVWGIGYKFEVPSE